MRFFKPSGAVGLELDTGVIRVVELKGTLKSPSLVAAGRISIPESAVVEGVVQDSALVVAALTQLWTNVRISSRDVVLGIYNKGVFLRSASLPKVPENKIPQLLRFQSEDFFPIPYSELVMDYAIVGEPEGPEGKTLDLLLVATRLETQRPCYSALLAAGITPKAVEASPIALLHTVGNEDLAGVTVFVDIANGLTSMLLAVDGIPRFSRILPHTIQSLGRGGRDRDIDSSSQVAVTMESGQVFAGEAESVDMWARELAGHVRASSQFYLSKNNITNVNRVILSGKGARLTGLTDILRQEIDLPIKVIRPLSKITPPHSVQGVNIGQEAADFAVCLGLALHGLED